MLANPPPQPGRGGGFISIKNCLPRNRMKYLDLHRKIMFANSTTSLKWWWDGLEYIPKLFGTKDPDLYRKFMFTTSHLSWR